MSETQGSRRNAYDGRLNGDSEWLVPSGASYPWIQVDIGYVTSVSGLLTQGDARVSYWITQLKVQTAVTISGFSPYMVNITQTEFMII